MRLSTILVLWMVPNRCRMQRSWFSCIRKFFRLSRRMCRHCSYYCYNNNIFSRSLEYKILCWWGKYSSGRFQIHFNVFLPKLFWVTWEFLKSWFLQVIGYIRFETILSMWWKESSFRSHGKAKMLSSCEQKFRRYQAGFHGGQIW